MSKNNYIYTNINKNIVKLEFNYLNKKDLDFLKHA